MSQSLREAFNRMRSFFRKHPLDEELEQEIASHLEMAVEENKARGLPAGEARRQALARFGGVQQAREKHRESRGLPWLDVMMQDLSFTFRTMRRSKRNGVWAMDAKRRSPKAARRS